MGISPALPLIHQQFIEGGPDTQPRCVTGCYRATPVIDITTHISRAGSQPGIQIFAQIEGPALLLCAQFKGKRTGQTARCRLGKGPGQIQCQAFQAAVYLDTLLACTQGNNALPVSRALDQPLG